MKIYKLWEFHIPDDVFDFQNKISNTGMQVKLTNNYVVFSAQDKKKISLNGSSTKVAFQLDDIRFSSLTKKAGKYTITYFDQIGADMSYVLHEGHFDKDQVINSLLGLSVSDSDNNVIDFSFKVSSDSITINFSSPLLFQITVNKDGSTVVDGTKSTDTLNYTKDTLTVKAATDNKTIYETASTLPAHVDLVDANIDNYYIEYDPDNKTLVRKQLKISGYKIDNYGGVLNVLEDTGIAANMMDVYMINEDAYTTRGAYALAAYNNSKIISTQVSRIISLFINKEDNVYMHNYGFFKTSDRVYPSFGRFHRNIVEIKFYRAKSSSNPCVFSNDNSQELAFMIYVRKNRGVQLRHDKTVKTELVYSDANFANELLHKLNTGFGVFYNSLFDIREYQDDGSHIKILFNYQNNKHYYQIDIYDENMRYKIVETKKVNGDTRQTTTYYRMYNYNPILNLEETNSNINILKKIAIDFISDIDMISSYQSKVNVPSFSVLERSNILMVNPNNFDVTLPSAAASLDLFSKAVLLIDNSQNIFDILYQPTSDTLYAYDEKNKKRININDFIKLFNNTCDNYKMQATCSYAKLQYKTIDNKELELQFPISTMFLIELVNGPNGIYYRIYYKNAEDVGHLETISHKIIDL